MPAEHRLRLHQHEVPAPVGAQAPHHNPEEPVVPNYTGPPTGAQRHRDLLPQEQVLQQQRAVITARPAEDAGEERHASELEAVLADHVVCRVSAPRMEFSRPTTHLVTGLPTSSHDGVGHPTAPHRRLHIMHAHYVRSSRHC